MLDWLRKNTPQLRQNKDFFKFFDQSLPLVEYPFVVFDTELTRLDRRRGEIISIGAVKINNLQIELGETFHEYVKPLKLHHTDATLIHKITPEQLKLAPDIGEVIPSFLEFLGTSLIVGHCIEIDMEFLDKACRKLFGGTLSNPTIDTMKMARGCRRVTHGQYHDLGLIQEGYTLQELSQRFNLPLFQAHNAFDDAMQTAYLFVYLAKKFQTSGLETLQDLYRICKTGTWDEGRLEM